MKLPQRGLFAFLCLAQGIEFSLLYDRTEAPHTLSSPEGLSAAPSLRDVCAAWWAGQPWGWSSEALEQAGAGIKDTSWLLWISTKIQQHWVSYFHKTRSANTERTWLL